MLTLEWLVFGLGIRSLTRWFRNYARAWDIQSNIKFTLQTHIVGRPNALVRRTESLWDSGCACGTHGTALRSSATARESVHLGCRRTGCAAKRLSESVAPQQHFDFGLVASFVAHCGCRHRLERQQALVHSRAVGRTKAPAELPCGRSLERSGG